MAVHEATDTESTSGNMAVRAMHKSQRRAYFSQPTVDLLRINEQRSATNRSVWNKTAYQWSP